MKVSIIIPVYNDFDNLIICIKALEYQLTSFNFEVIISDDGSTDKTYIKTKKWCKDKPNFKVISNIHKGPANARNNGVLVSCGEIIIFTDADCVPFNDWIQKNIEYLIKNPDIDAVKGIYKTKQNSIIANLCQIEFETRYKVLESFETTDFIDSYSAAIKKEAFNNISGFDTSYKTANNEDVDLSFRLNKAGYKIGFSRDIKVYHTHPSTWLNYFKTKYWRAFYRMKVYKKHSDKIKKDSYTPFAMKLQILFFPFLILSLFSKRIRAKAFIIFTSLMIPFIKTTADYNLKYIVIVPFFIFIRTTAFLFGILTGIKENLK